MLTLPPTVRIFVATAPCDLRKQFDGIAVLVEQGLRHDPRSGHLYVVFNRRGDQVRILFWDRQGRVPRRSGGSSPNPAPDLGLVRRGSTDERRMGLGAASGLASMEGLQGGGHASDALACRRCARNASPAPCQLGLAPL